MREPLILFLKGSGFLIDCRRQHLYKTVGSSWDHVELHMRGACLEQLYEMYHASGEVVFRPANHAAFLEELDTIIRTDTSIDPYREVRLSAQLNNLLIELLTSTDSYQSAMHSMPIQIQPLRRYIENNFMKEMSLDRLAEISGLSKYHMCRLFQQYMGFSIGEYIIDLRIRRAKDLLSLTNLTAAQVGYAIGIKNENYFYRLFKKKTGVTPKQYAKNNR